MHLSREFWHVLEIIVLVLAVVVLPTEFQMFTGRPNLTFEPKLVRGQVAGQATILYITIHNKPVAASLLIKLGVRRDPANITAAIQIRDEITGNPMTRPATPSDPESDQPMRDVDLPAGVFGRDALVLRAIENDAITYEDNKIVQLRPANYLLEIRAWAGEIIFVRTLRFVVTANRLNSYWVE